jgi:hypothetical protein
LDRAAAAVECRRKAETALMEAKACYLGWTAKKDEPFSFRRAIMGTREEHRKRYDESSQSSESCPAHKPTTLAARLLKNNVAIFTTPAWLSEITSARDADVCFQDQFNSVAV